jgi:hypothetical protein
MDPSATDRRAFLKASAIVAAPLAAAVPAVALAADDTRTRLARLEDERAIEALHRALLRQLNGAGPRLAPVDTRDGLCTITEDPAHDAILEFDTAGRGATLRCTCLVSREVAFTGDSTLERMARFEGRGSHRAERAEALATHFVKGADGWRIAAARLV